MKYSVIIAVAVLLTQCSSVPAALTLADGRHHVIDYAVTTVLKVDTDAPGMGTTVDLVEGGSVRAWIDAYEDSRVTILAGQVGGSLNLRGNSHVTIVGGEIGGPVSARRNSRLDISAGSMTRYVQTFDDVQATISGGHIALFVQSWNDSRITISGGTIGDRIGAIGDSLITLVGDDFAVDGVPVGYGDFVSDFSRNGAITGILANGDALDVPFHLNGIEADIVFIPEPATVLMLGLGGLSLLRRRRG